MQVIESSIGMARWAKAARGQRQNISFVPTMGYLHEGHLALLREARLRGNKLVASIFVNPLQFAPHEDFETYPRDPDRDAGLCAEAGVDALFMPTREELYPSGYQTRVRAGFLADALCGGSRPEFFHGVATVVLKLFQLVRPHVAVFGQKDYQQLLVIRRMVRDFHLEVDVLGHPTVREPDGLAMSSRNVYLSPEERAQAQSLNQGLAAARDLLAGGERAIGALTAAVRDRIAAQPLSDIDYVDLVDGTELTPLAGDLVAPGLLAVAVRFGRTRLIDNCLLEPPRS